MSNRQKARAHRIRSHHGPRLDAAADSRSRRDVAWDVWRAEVARLPPNARDEQNEEMTRLLLQRATDLQNRSTT